MAPSQVKNSGRAIMSGLADYRDDMSGALETAGANSAYTLATNSGLVDANTDYFDNVCVAFVPHATNAASPTLNVDSGGALPLRGASGVALGAGVLIEGTPYVALLSADKTEWLIHGYRNEPTTIPIGGVLPYTNNVAPNSNFVLAYGQAISRTTYATYFNMVSARFGAGDGSTTFQVPDLRGRAIFGLDNMGGSAANVLTTSGSGVDGSVWGTYGGAQNVTLARANLPNVSITSSSNGAHQHLLFGDITTSNALTASNVPAVSNTVSPTPAYTIAGSATSATLGLSQSAGAHDHTVALNGGVTQTTVSKIPPCLVLPFIIRVL
ncbi:MAG: phage tail protein [Hyphomicrobiaceae bacterium]|nr:phage tail protein [Hyphomicrobiaceae bacterium]